jgi:negative regulator of sigma E activity
MMHAKSRRSDRKTPLRTLFAWVALAVLGGLTAPPACAADLRDLLRRSTTAERRISYQGRKSLARWANGQTVTGIAKVYHRAPDETLIVGIDGELEGNRVLQLGREHFQMVRGDRYRQVNHLPSVDNTELMLRNYRLRQMRVEQIARRKCVMVSIEPRNPGNPRKLVWLDVETALPLKTQIWNSDGVLTEESAFILIQYHPKLAPSVFRLPANAVRDRWPTASPDFNVVRVAESGLPPGYQLVETDTRYVPHRGIVSIQRFSDGLNTLSLLQSVRLSARQLAALGGSAEFSGQVGAVSYALCGEQDSAALRRIARSLQGHPRTILGAKSAPAD